MFEPALSVIAAMAPAAAQQDAASCAKPAELRIGVRPGALLAAARNRTAAAWPVKAYAFYFGAAWCGPCRIQVRAMKPLYETGEARRLGYELVFVSLDRDADAAAAYVGSERMPWPYLPPAEKTVRAAFKNIAPRSAPDMIVVDAEGRVLCGAYDPSGRYRGVAQILAALRRSLGARP